MEFKFTAEDEEFRAELRAFMKAELPDPWGKGQAATPKTMIGI